MFGSIDASGDSTIAIESPRVSTSRPIPSRGLTVVVNPDKPDTDIVFIHGFKGGPERSWTERYYTQCSPAAPQNFEPTTPNLQPRISSGSIRGRSRKPVDCFWPRDLLPATFPNARVMTYGYDIEMLHWLTAPVDKQTLYDVANDFMSVLSAERQAQPRRPIIFVAHSLGGIILKQMLHRSSCSNSAEGQNTRKIFKSTVGIIFFGVPHTGTDPQSLLLSFARMILQGLGYSINSQISNALVPGAAGLQMLSDNFDPMAKERNWKIYSFQERYGSRRTMLEKVVEDGSSYLGIAEIETTQHIDKDHFHMTKFNGADDPDFKKVEAALRALKSKITQVSEFAQALEMMKAKVIKCLLLLSAGKH